MDAQGKKIYYGIVLDNAQLRQDAEQSKNIFRGIGDASKDEASRIDNAFRKIAGAAAAVFTVQQAANFANSIVRVRGEVEALSISFETLLGGNKQKAHALFSEIRTFAVNTPMMLNDLARGAQMLLSFNIEAERVMPILKQIGDISMGDAQKFNSLTLAFSQMMSTGKLMGQDLLQMINAGFNPLSVISEKTGKSIGQLKKDMEAGAISSEMVADAFAAATAEGGKFYGMLEKQSKGINGSISNLKGAIEDMLNDIGTANQDIITGSISAATSVVRHYKEIGEIIAVLVATYGTYQAALIATEAVRKSVETVQHTEEAAELYKLLTAEQQAQISKKGLAKTSAEYYAIVKAETAANVQAAQSALTKARADVTAANQAVVSRRAEYIAAKQLEAQRLTELTAISATGTAKQTEAAQRKLAAAETQRESAAIAFQSATRDFNAKKTAVETAARTANTTATAVNTAAQTANATATGFLTVAKTRLAAVAARLNAVIMANPYALAAAAAIALGYGLYKLGTYQTSAEKAQSKLNDAIKASSKEIDSEVHQIDAMFGRLKAAKQGTDEYRAAKEAIMNRYGEYMKKLGDEKTALNDIAAAYSLITEEAKKAARARAMETFTKDAADTLAEKESDVKDEVKKLLDKKYKGQKGADGVSLSETYYWKIKPVIEGEAEITDEIRNIIGAFERTKMVQTGIIPGSDAPVYSEIRVNDLQTQMDAAAKARGIFNRSMAQARIKFGENPTAGDEGQTAFDAATASLQQLMDRLPKAKGELTALKKAEIPDPAAIAAKEQEIKQIKDQTEARERELSIIKDVKAQIETLQKQQLDYGKDDEEYKSLEARVKYLKTKLPLTDGQFGKTVSRQSKYDNQIRQEAIQRQRAEEDLEFSVQQARIDAMKDGIDKVLAQNALNHKRELLDIERQKQDLLKAIQDQERTIWEAKNPDWEKKGLKFTPTVTKLPTETLEKFDKLLETAKNKKQKSDVDYLTAQFDQEVVDWNEYYKKYGTFRERLQATKDEYDQKMQEAKNTGEKAALQTEMDEVLAEFEVEASGFVEELTNKTTGKLETMLKNAQKQLEVVRKKFKALDSSTSIEAKQYKDTINKLEAQIKVLQNQLSKAKETASDKDWAQSAELFQAISSGARDAAEGVRDFDEGLADVLTTIANITAGIGGMIAAITAIGAAVSAAEKASAILAVIAAAIQIVSGLFSIFSGGESAVEKTCREFAELNDELIRLKREAAINSWEDTIFGADEWKNASENMKIYVEAFERYNNTLEDIRKRGQEVYVDFHGRNSDWVVTEKANLDKMAKTWETAAQSIFNMQVQTRHSTWFRSAKYASLGSLLPGIFNEDGTLNMDALKEFQGNDLYKKLTKENRAFIDALISDWELYEEALDEVKGYLSDIFGDLGETITDVLVDAFANGTDAAKGFADSVSEMLENLAKNMIYSVTLAPLMEKAQKDILAIMGDAGLSDDQKFEKYAGVLAYLTDEALAQQENANYLMKLYQEMAAQKGIDIFQPDGEREASSKGIATASQDSVEELNGRFTVIQSHTFDIREAVNAIAASKTQDLMKIEINTERLHTIDANVFGIREASNMLVANSARMLQHLAGIEDNTSRLHAMDDNIANMRNEVRTVLSSVGHAVSDMALKGLKLRTS